MSPSTTVVPVRKTRALAGVLLIGGGAAALIPGWARREAARRRGRPLAITAAAGSRPGAWPDAGMAELVAGDGMAELGAGDEVIEASDWY